MVEEHSAAQHWAALTGTRRSIREFRPDPVPAHLLDAVLGDAITAPSWSNTQPYRLAVATGIVRDRISVALCRRFDEAARARRGSVLARMRFAVRQGGRPRGDFDVPRTYPPELQERRRATGFGLYSVLGIDREDQSARDRQLRRNFEFFDAPTVVFIFVHEHLGSYSVLDAGLLLQTLMLSAHAHGLGTCAQGALALWPEPVRDAFLVPEQYRLLCGVSIGYPADAPVNAYAPTRRSVLELLLPVRDPSVRDG